MPLRYHGLGRAGDGVRDAHVAVAEDEAATRDDVGARDGLGVEEVVQLEVARRQRVVRRRRLVGQLPHRGADDRRRDVAVVEQRAVGAEALLTHELLVVELARPAPRRGGGAGCAAWAGCCRPPGSAPWASASPSSASDERTLVYRYCNSGVRSRSCQGRRSRRSSTASSTTPRSSRRAWPRSTWPCASTSTDARGRMPSTSARCSCPPPRRTSSHALAAADPRTPTAPLEVGLVVRPGSPAAARSSTPLASLRDDDRRRSSRAVELGLVAGVAPVLDAEVPVVVEVGLGDDAGARRSTTSPPPSTTSTT